ncbi:DUF551 domain-containing protein [Salmonella enterica]
MTTITKERIELFVKNPLENGLTRGEQMELARIALASLDAEPVGEVSEKRHGLVMDGTVDLGGKLTYRIIKGEKAMKRLPLGTKFYIVPPVPVDNEFIPKNLDKALGVVGVALPESKEEFNFQTERWIQRLIDRVIRYADEFKEQPVPVVPEEMPKGLAGQIVSLLAHNIGDKFLAQKIWNACRAAMLHGAEPVSQTNKLPHTQFEQVADLYEMQFDDGRTCAFHTDAQKAVQWLQACDGNRVQEYVKLERLQNALAGNSPVTPDGWISCSERMPAQDDWVLIYSKYGEYLAGQVQGEYVELNDGTLSWLWSALHWMPLPEPPQQ